MSKTRDEKNPPASDPGPSADAPDEKLRTLLRAWRAPDAPPSLDDRVLVAYRRLSAPWFWKRVFAAEITVPAPIAVAFGILFLTSSLLAARALYPARPTRTRSPRRLSPPWPVKNGRIRKRRPQSAPRQPNRGRRPHPLRPDLQSSARVPRAGARHIKNDSPSCRHRNAGKQGVCHFPAIGSRDDPVGNRGQLSIECRPQDLCRQLF